MKPILLIGGLGLVAYYVYKNYMPTTTTGTTPGTTVTPTPTPGYNYNSLAAIAARIQQAAGSQSFTRDQWNYYLAQASGITPPAPGDVWGASETGAYDPNELIPFASYWGKMSAYLVSALGMSGLRGWEWEDGPRESYGPDPRGSLGTGAYFLFFRKTITTTATQQQTVGQQVYNNPADIYRRLQSASGGQPLLNMGQWNQLLAQYSTLTPAPSASLDPTARITLDQFWTQAYGNLPTGMGWV